MTDSRIEKIRFAGPERAGCHDLPELDSAKWLALGGQDIQVWGPDWIVEGTPESIAYLREIYPSLAE